MTLASYMTEKGLTDGDLAASLGVSGELVRLWRHGHRAISAKRAITISEVTGIPRHELRPDLWDAPALSPSSPANDTPKPKAKRPTRSAGAAATPPSPAEAA
jgi:DNA-binding transcriptional regulator YdaS (Cro superfamily)